MNDYYCPICGKKACGQIGAICVSCRAIHRARGPSGPAEVEGDCFYCREHRHVIVGDHVVPLMRGGPDVPWNKVRCCELCNLAKSDLLPSEWCPGNAEAMEIQEKVKKILPRMRRGRLSGNVNQEEQVFFSLFAACVSFSSTLTILHKEMSHNKTRPRILTLWQKVEDLRAYLVDHPVLMSAMKKGDEK